MKPQDVEVWERFIKTYPNAYEEVAYDVAVGEGAPVPAGTPENIAADFKLLTQRKIDVVGFSKGEVHVIEVKPIASFTALGQVLGYTKLYLKTAGAGAAAQPVIIAGKLGTDMEHPINEFGVKIIIV